MKNLIQFAVKNPVAIGMIVLAILLLGKISYDRLNVDLMPEINTPRLFVEVEAGERPPEEIEKMFIENMESLAIRQTDVTQVSTVIKVGSARITVEYVQNKDMDEAFLDLQKAMNSFLQTEGIESINITQHDPNTDPVVLVAMSHNTIDDMADLRKMAESYIRNELIRIEGVAEVEMSGEENQELLIKTDPYKLSAFGLTIESIAQRIQSNNQSVSGGRISELGLQYIVKSSSLFLSENDFRNLIVSYKPTTQTQAGQASAAAERAPLMLGEVADIQFENARPENIVRLNGQRCIGLSIYKEMQSNTVKVVQLIDKQLKIISQALPGYNFQIISNQGTFIESAIDEVKSSALLGLALAVIVLFIFLRRVGTTLIVSLSIPISLIATFNMMYFGGLTLNIMTLSGLALGGGMLIDNAIVVIESIFRNQETGLSRKDAIVSGTYDVSGAVVTATLSSIIVFLPIVYLHGASGELFKDQALTVAFSQIASIFVALLVIPMLYDKMIGKRKIEAPQSDTLQFKGYGNFIYKLLKNRWLVIGISAVFLLIAIVLTPFLGTEFLPHAEGKTFNISVKLPEGTRLERTDKVVNSLENIIYEVSGDSLCTIYSHAGKGASNDDVFEDENTASLKVILSKQSKVKTEDVIARLAERTSDVEGLELTFKQDNNTLNSLFGDEESPITVEVKGEDLDEISAISDEVLQRMQTMDGIFNVRSSMADGAPELTVTLNRTMAGVNNISVSTVISQISNQLQGSNSGKMDYKGEMRDIVIKMPDITVGDLEDLKINSNGQEFRLREIADIQSSLAPKEIFRRNQGRINKILADMDVKKSLDKTAEQIYKAVADIDLPPNYSIKVTGEEEKRQESMKSLMFALLLSVVLVYMMLASFYESLLHPFTILLTIPLALVGAVFLFFITGTTINIMGVIGIIMLGGIAVNNSILLVDRINQLKTDRDLTEAIVQAGQQRIRPIMMTTLTTILALLPMAFNFGDGAELRSSMVIAVVGGLVTSTLMSLCVIPCVYYVFERLKERRKK
ncbi:MAG: efflux RND transporter permease subunit [Tannerella sp.]|jgi:HAE1 family hydrophobic/amphiphilic exporter-1|nr:efflux RND transporter permease subunit [Tannerella sp.]